MLIPESRRAVAIETMRRLLDAPETEILAVGPNGVALKDKFGNRLEITLTDVFFTPVEKSR
jgi:hypothetical protein